MMLYLMMKTQPNNSDYEISKRCLRCFDEQQWYAKNFLFDYIGDKNISIRPGVALGNLTGNKDLKSSGNKYGTLTIGKIGEYDPIDSQTRQELDLRKQNDDSVVVPNVANTVGLKYSVPIDSVKKLFKKR